MDVFEVLQELHKNPVVDTLSRPLVLAEKSYGSATTTARHSRTREVSSRYKSPTRTPTPSTTSISRRHPSPNLNRDVNASSTQLGSSKRALSPERKRPSTPPSPSRPSTPVSNTAVDSHPTPKKTINSRLSEVLWPSTMRSLSVSFQSDSISVSVSKKEKEKSVSHALLDRTLKPSSNSAPGPRKATPERKRSPLKGKILCHQSENSRPVDGAQARLIDQHRWPSPTRQSSTIASVLSFVADIKKGKKTNQLEDAHQLRLLYNRQLQWRFANACADGALYVQKITNEETNLEMWDSVVRKRIELQRFNQDVKLNLLLREQADIDSLKPAIRSAADVMQVMGSSICSLLSKAEGMNGLVSELSELAGHERDLLNECSILLSSPEAMQEKEYSLRTQLI